MHLSDDSLRLIDDAYIQSLEVEALRDLSLRLLADLQKARERLNQGPTNSRAPWERGDPADFKLFGDQETGVGKSGGSGGVRGE